MIELAIPLLKDYGLPLALCVVLMWAIWYLNGQIMRMVAERTAVQDSQIKDLSSRLAKLEAVRAEELKAHGEVMAGLSAQYASVIKEHSALVKDMLAVLRRLIDSLTARPCLHGAPAEPQPHPHPAPVIQHPGRVRPPTSAELPPDPTQAPTEALTSKNRGHG